MDRLLYISSVGAANLERAQAVHAHNLANVSTDGYRSEFAHTIERVVQGDGYSARVYGVTQDSGFDGSSGVLRDTGRSLDVAIGGDGYLAVQLPDGSEGFTRAGSLKVDEFGRLLSAENHPVIGQGGPIALPPYETLVIGSDGSVTVRAQGQGAETLVQVAQLKLVKAEPQTLVKNAYGTLSSTTNVPSVPDESIQLVSGMLESSNVNPVNELTEVLSLARQFELEVRMMRTAQTNDEAASELVRVG